jgi:hypothetical protein
MTPNKDRRFVSDHRISAYWHFPQDRFDTSKHPIITNVDKPRFKLACLISHQENQRLNGLINTLQVEEREAIRIALFECCLRDEKELEPFIDQAKTITKARGHQTRNLQLTARATEDEKKNAQAKAKELGITEKEMIRIAIIWLGAMTKDGSLKRLTKSKRLSDIECAKQWNKENKNKPRTNKAEAFVTAKEVGMAKKILHDLRAQPEREIIKAQLFASGVLQLLKNRYPHYKNIKIERDAYYKELNKIIDEQIIESQASVISEIAESRGIPEDEPILNTDAEIFLLMHSLDVEYDLAKLFYEDEQKEKEKIEALPLAEQLSHYNEEIEQIKSYKVARENRDKTREERKAAQEAYDNKWREELRAKEKEEEESLESSTFLKAVANDERINNPLRLGATAGNEYGWRSIPDRVIWLPSTTGPLANGVHPNTLQDNPEYLDTIDSWQIDDGPPDTLV